MSNYKPSSSGVTWLKYKHRKRQKVRRAKGKESEREKKKKKKSVTGTYAESTRPYISSAVNAVDELTNGFKSHVYALTST